MDKVIIEIIKNLPSWFFTIAALILLCGMIAAFWWLVQGSKRFSDAIGRENRVIEIQNELVVEKNRTRENVEIANQLMTALENIKPFIESLNQVRTESEDGASVRSQAGYLVQRVVESLVSEVKHLPGERHRCGLWFREEDLLTLTVASTGFPSNYVNNRVLSVNKSIAGTALRRQQTIKRDNVQEDEDWEPNPSSSSSYKAIICIPLSNWGVLTIDAMKPMKDEVVVIGELYAKIIEGGMHEFFRGLSLEEQALRDSGNSQQIAATSQNEL